MRVRPAVYLQDYFRALLALVVTVCSVRFYEYFFIAAKSFVSHAYTYELAGLFYDVWACLLYGIFLCLAFCLLRLAGRRIAVIVMHGLNVLAITAYVSLIVIFSERNTPFDHEIFTRSAAESWLTTKQMMTSGVMVYMPFILYIFLYFLLYHNVFRFVRSRRRHLYAWGSASILALLCIFYANPQEGWFGQKTAYHLTCNKFVYWFADNLSYFRNKDSFDAGKLTSGQLASEISFYQQNHPFNFTGKEYPLVHTNNSQDVLGNFFNLDTARPPNIVILVVEGLSRDFSGDKAYAGSFTPFLDSLSEKSLCWDNFLSTAPGTFAAHPAISGSLPYGKRGFSVINVMPDHLSLIKILRSNGYHAKFLIGFNPDFDNMGGFMRLQGTDFILSQYPSKYKEMGAGSEGWSMGYPDDALFDRSFEVMDSLPYTPYLNIYHTATTHMPYLFAQHRQYEKLFDKKLRALPGNSKVKRTLRQTKQVLVTFMFADDCIRDFFAKYSKRSEYKNTIFFITGDHHIGSFPSTCTIDDYHVPFIIYSPMLKAPKKFYSVNSHNNLAPTITSLILNNYPLPNKPGKVHWLSDVMDTAASFRNIQSMPFMAWSREMTDYLYKGYFLSGNVLYQLTPDLLQEEVVNDPVKTHMKRLLDNFKYINSYVCDNNKVYPPDLPGMSGHRELLLDYSEAATRTFFTKSPDTSILPLLKIPGKYTYLYVELSAETNLHGPGVEDQPSFRMALIDTTRQLRNFVFWTHHDIVQIAKGDYREKQWNTVSTNDMFALGGYRQFRNLVFDLSFYTQVQPLNLQLRNLKMKVYGISN